MIKEGFTRYVLDVRYLGTHYSGWQMQPNATTIQGELDRVLSTLLKRPLQTYGAGRTDAGVHAAILPAHFDYDQPLHPAFFKSLNAMLPKGISVMKVHRALDPGFHARFSADSRAYRYNLIFDRDAFLYQRSWWVKERVDVAAMQSAAQVIMEFDSFESFCKANGNNKTFFCKIMESYFEWEGSMLVYRVKADRFLRGMVRAIVGTLFEVGKGNLDEEGLREILRSKDRRRAGSSAIADGLYLTEVNYPAGMLEEVYFPRK